MVKNEIILANIGNISQVFELQKAKTQELKQHSAGQRKQKLLSIKHWISAHYDDICKAIQADFGKHATETLISEVLVVQGEIKHLLKEIDAYMAPKKVPTTATMLTTSAWVQYEPKGRVLIIAPWNYPFNLAIKPLVQAIAAGNTVILKPSELTPHTSALLAAMLSELFDPSEVAVIQGGIDVSQNLLQLPFDHIFFTGSTAVGKIVMAAAAQNLCSVTLELGGKCPVILDETAPLEAFCKSIAWAKCFNAGQTCIAPDYLLVKKSVAAQVLKLLDQNIKNMYGQTPTQTANSESYARIINEKHFNRLTRLIANATLNGAELSVGGQHSEKQLYLAPTVLTNVSTTMDIMKEEIFGPILPIITYENLDEAIEIIQSLEKPLALYIGSKNTKNIRYLLDQTTAGGVVINDIMIHYGHSQLPFGGVNSSGIGKSGGQWGFLEFSNQKAVIKQHKSLNFLLYAPYTKKIDSLVRTIIKYFS
jgi:aldehyde dehydrogenase (NAD+)